MNYKRRSRFFFFKLLFKERDFLLVKQVLCLKFTILHLKFSNLYFQCLHVVSVLRIKYLYFLVEFRDWIRFNGGFH
jgi:hypothetical protein